MAEGEVFYSRGYAKLCRGWVESGEAVGTEISPVTKIQACRRNTRASADE